MEKLRQIMSDLVDIEYSLQSFSSLLGELDEIYEYKHNNKQKENVWLFKMLVDSLSENLSDRISEIDQFLIDSKKQQ